jgi:hypothetical protein
VPYELDAFDRFLHDLDAKKYHFVTGDRTLEASSYDTEIPRLQTLGSHVYSFLVGRFVAGGWFDTQCGLEGFRGAAAEDLFRVGKIPGFAFDVELFYVALERNYDIKRLPVRLRVQEGSSVRIVRDGLAMTGDLAVIRWHQLAGHYRPVSPVIVGIECTWWPRGRRRSARAGRTHGPRTRAGEAARGTTSGGWIVRGPRGGASPSRPCTRGSEAGPPGSRARTPRRA